MQTDIQERRAQDSKNGVILLCTKEILRIVCNHQNPYSIKAGVYPEPSRGVLPFQHNFGLTSSKIMRRHWNFCKPHSVGYFTIKALKTELRVGGIKEFSGSCLMSNRLNDFGVQFQQGLLITTSVTQIKPNQLSFSASVKYIYCPCCFMVSQSLAEHIPRGEGKAGYEGNQVKFFLSPCQVGRLEVEERRCLMWQLI